MSGEEEVVDEEGEEEAISHNRIYKVTVQVMRHQFLPHQQRRHQLSWLDLLFCTFISVEICGKLNESILKQNKPEVGRTHRISTLAAISLN